MVIRSFVSICVRVCVTHMTVNMLQASKVRKKIHAAKSVRVCALSASASIFVSNIRCVGAPWNEIKLLPIQQEY